MLLAIVILLSGITLFFLMPLLALKRYYSPSQYSFLYNIFWFFVTVITWPLVPIIIAMRRKDRSLLTMFWLSFLLFVCSFGYWLYINLEQVIYLAGDKIA